MDDDAVHAGPSERTVRMPLHMPEHIAPKRSRALRNMVGYDVPDNVGRGMDVVRHYLGPVDKRALHASGIAHHGARNPALMEREFDAQRAYDKAYTTSEVMQNFGIEQMLAAPTSDNSRWTRHAEQADAGSQIHKSLFTPPIRRFYSHDFARYPGAYSM